MRIINCIEIYMRMDKLNWETEHVLSYLWYILYTDYISYTFLMTHILQVDVY